jgi:hypothetical protein
LLHTALKIFALSAKEKESPTGTRNFRAADGAFWVCERMEAGGLQRLAQIGFDGILHGLFRYGASASTPIIQ